MTRGLALVASLLLVTGCASEKEAAYQRFADELNPILVTLILKVAAIKALGPTAEEDDPRLATACAATDAELGRVNYIHVDDLSIDPGIRGAAGLMRTERHTLCRWLPGETRPASTCRWSCLDAWSLFTKEVAVLRAAARAEGVFVMALPQVAGPQKVDD